MLHIDKNYLQFPTKMFNRLPVNDALPKNGCIIFGHVYLYVDFNVHYFERR